MNAHLFLPLLALACTSPERKTRDESGARDSEKTGDTAPADTLDTSPDSTPDSSSDSSDSGEEIPWGEGPRAVSGQAFFFDMREPGVLEWVRDVEGAEVWVLEAPALSATLDVASEHVFRIEGIPEDVDVTLALGHSDYFPHLTATWHVGHEDLEGISFQAVSNVIATLTGLLLGADASDPSRCQMSTTVSAPGASSVWASGEPGATVQLDPPVPPEQGPFYFNEAVIPDPSRTETSIDGGVIVVDAEPGVYTWTGHKEGVEFDPLQMRCEGGWLTNASPPWGMNAHAITSAPPRD